MACMTRIGRCLTSCSASFVGPLKVSVRGWLSNLGQDLFNGQTEGKPVSTMQGTASTTGWLWP